MRACLTILTTAPIEAMADAGAIYRIAQGGSLIVRGLSELPPELQAMFLHADQRALVAAGRAHLASITARP